MRFEALQDVKRRLTEPLFGSLCHLRNANAIRPCHSSIGFRKGTFGLMKAVDMFQYRRGLSFSTSRRVVDPSRHYAAITIGADHPATRAQGGINESHRQHAGAPHLLGRDPTIEEIATHARMTAKSVTLMLQTGAPLLSLDAPVLDGPWFGEWTADTSASSPETVLLEEATLRQA